MAIAALLAVPLAIVAAPVSANAAAGLLCYLNTNPDGSAWCLSAPSIALYAPVVEGDGRRVIFGPYHQSSNEVLIEFASDTSKCVAAANNGTDVVVHPCSGVGVEWFLVFNAAGDAYRLNNAEFPSKFLAGPNNGTSQFQLKTPNQSGWYYQFPE